MDLPTPDPYKQEEQNSHSSKRNRISFVCKACRKSKTKCDREKPSCTRCIKNGIECVYDIEQQTQPRNPSKDATIGRLKKEVEYWQSKSMDYLSMIANHGPYKSAEGHIHKKIKLSDTQDQKSARNDSDGEKSVPSPDEIMINFYKSFPHILIKDCMTRDLKPSSAIAQIRQDNFLCTFIASVFSSASRNALIHTIPTEELPTGSSHPKLKCNILNLRHRMLGECENNRQRERVYEFTERILRGGTFPKKAKSGLFVALFSHTLHKTFVEDFCLDETNYSEILTDLINQIEGLLPSVEAIEIYKIHFYKYVYPIIPFLDIELFEECLTEVISKNPANPKKVKLRMGKRRLRSKIENLAILLAVLKLSYISMDFALAAEESSNLPQLSTSNINSKLMKENVITDEAISLSQRCVSSVNLFNWTSENSLCCLMYLWAYFVFAPEEGDYYLDQPTDIIMGMVTSLAVNIGLHRDPSEYEQFKDFSVIDHRLLNYRRKLWLCIVIVCRYESSLKGKCPQSMKDHMVSFLNVDNKGPDNYMNLVVGDMVTKDPLNLRMHKLCFKNYQLFLLLSELDAVTISLHHKVSLAHIEDLLERIHDFIDKNYPISDIPDEFSAEKIPIQHIPKLGETIDMLIINSASCFQTHTISRLVLLRVTSALFSYFEGECKNAASKYLPYYEKYFTKLVTETLELAKIFEKCFEGEFDAALFPFMKYLVDSTAQLCLSTVLHSLLGISLRMTHAESLLIHKLKQESYLYNNLASSPEISMNEKRLEVITTMKMDFEAALERLCNLASKSLRLSFFSTFQILLFFDYVLQIIKKGELITMLTRISKLKLPKCVRNSLFLGFAIDINRGDEILQKLNDSNFLPVLEIEKLRKVQNMMYAMNFSKVDLKPEMNVDLTQKNETPDCHTATGSFSNLDKLSSAAVISQALESDSLDYANKGASIPNVTNNINNETNYDGANLPLEMSLNTDGFDLFDYDFLFRDTT